MQDSRSARSRLGARSRLRHERERWRRAAFGVDGGSHFDNGVVDW